LRHKEGVLFNEQSSFCCPTEGFVPEQMRRINTEENETTKEEFDNAIKTIEKVERY